MMDSKAKVDKAGYKGHRPGSRKGVIHELFDEQGAEVAWTRGLKLKLKEATLRTWFSRWGESPAKVKAKPVAKAKPKPATKPRVVKAKPDVQPDSGATPVA
jgi:hypothetical protein